MKATLTYEGKTVEVEIAEEEARKIFEKPKTGWERVEPGQCYCYITGGGFVVTEEEERDEKDANGNYRRVTGKRERDPLNRSKTFPGIAEAMAEQWGGIENAV